MNSRTEQKETTFRGLQDAQNSSQTFPPTCTSFCLKKTEATVYSVHKDAGKMSIAPEKKKKKGVEINNFS